MPGKENQINKTEKNQIWDMIKNHIPNFASGKNRESMELIEGNVEEKPSESLDRLVDKAFLLFDRIINPLKIGGNKVGEVLKDGYYKAVIAASRVSTSIKRAKAIMRPIVKAILAELLINLARVLVILVKVLVILAKVFLIAASFMANTKGGKALLSTFVTITDKLKEKEELLSIHGANLVDRADRHINQIEDYLSDQYHFTVMELERGLHYAEHNKLKVFSCVGAGAVSVLAITLIIGSLTAYEYMYNGRTLGVVKEQDDVYRTIDAIGDKLSQEHHADVFIDKEEDITFEKVFSLGMELDDKEDILSRLTYMKNMKAKGQAIFIEGKQVAILKSEKVAKETLESIKNIYLNNGTGSQYEKVGFSEKVDIKEVDTKLGNIQNKAEVISYLLTGEKEKKIHTVAPGETISEIAKNYGLKQKELLASNPGMDPAKISIGQQLSLTQPVSMLTVKTEEVITYVESMPYEIAYQDVATKYEGTNTVKAEGINGQRKVVARIVKSNGVEVKKKELSSEILENPIPQVVLRGTKKMPPLVGTGSFVYPVRGTITSRYGSRWGSFHPAIDIATRSGTPIKASDGGKVIFAGYSGSYGNLVKIDHGGNRVTYYGHCSKLLVKTGDRVFQGMEIAKVGSTGNSTGPHLHFEVRINGETQNPLDYL